MTWTVSPSSTGDVHHGNGTQHIFDDDPDVFYASTHEYAGCSPDFQGNLQETGTGEGQGTTMNIPFPGGCGRAPEYLAAVDEAIGRAKSERYDPDLFFVSAGFDAHRKDPILAPARLEAEGYGLLTERVVDLGRPVWGGAGVCA
ncbi:MAG: hypothetical protein U5K28_08555 [Halobacteriales archaeon]|nr:hypothetical protein [Halobacteriales archaeon]